MVPTEDENVVSAPPIQFAVADAKTHQLQPERYETHQEAVEALSKQEGEGSWEVVETRESHQLDPELQAAEEAQIDENGQRDADEPSSGLDEVREDATEDQLNHVVEQQDSDGDGIVNPEEETHNN